MLFLRRFFGVPPEKKLINYFFFFRNSVSEIVLICLVCSRNALYLLCSLLHNSAISTKTSNTNTIVHVTSGVNRVVVKNCKAMTQ